jgi:hypothetical protein
LHQYQAELHSFVRYFDRNKWHRNCRSTNNHAFTERESSSNVMRPMDSMQKSANQVCGSLLYRSSVDFVEK